MEIAPDYGFLTGCRFNDSSAATIPFCAAPPCDELPSSDLGKIFMANIVWGDEAWSEMRTPADTDTKQITIGGRPAWLIEGENYNGSPQCAVKLALERGAAGVAVADGRFGIDTCALVHKLATLIAERSS